MARHLPGASAWPDNKSVAKNDRLKNFHELTEIWPGDLSRVSSARESATGIVISDLLLWNIFFKF